ncbi:hypothetical protein D3C71_1341850 [compost metagenome]
MRVDRIPPELGHLAHALIGHGGLPAGLLQCGIGPFVGGGEHVAVIGPHRPEPGVPGIIHRHAADKAVLDLVLRLQALARRDEFVPGLGNFVRLYQIGTVEEHAIRMRHRHKCGSSVGVVEDDAGRGKGVHIFYAFDVIHRLEHMGPQLSPIVVVPDHVELVRTRGQRGSHFLQIDPIGIGDLDDLHTVGLAPFFQQFNRGCLDRVGLEANAELFFLCQSPAGR